MGSEKAGDLLSDAAKDTTNIAEKVGRLAESANKSIKDMSNLFADSKVPSNEEFAAARKQVEDSLRELENIDIPESLDETDLASDHHCAYGSRADHGLSSQLADRCRSGRSSSPPSCWRVRRHG